MVAYERWSQPEVQSRGQYLATELYFIRYAIQHGGLQQRALNDRTEDRWPTSPPFKKKTKTKQKKRKKKTKANKSSTKFYGVSVHSQCLRRPSLGLRKSVALLYWMPYLERRTRWTVQLPGWAFVEGVSPSSGLHRRVKDSWPCQWSAGVLPCSLEAASVLLLLPCRDQVSFLDLK